MPPFAEAVVSSGRDDSDQGTAHASRGRHRVSGSGRDRRHGRGRPGARTPPRRPAPIPDGGIGDVHELLTAAVDEAARLLDADGAMVYLLDPATGHLRFAHDAGIRSRRSRELGPLDRPARSASGCSGGRSPSGRSS